MKVLFVYPNIEKSIQEHLGIAYLSAMLKKEGIETFLWDNTFETIENLKDKIKSINPDFVCVTALSTDYEYAIELCKIIKSIKKVKIIIGGPHVTFLPQEAIIENCFDVVIRGEGEESLLNYIKNQNNKTEGAWIKEDNIIYINDVGKLPNLNKLPWPDHNTFKKHFKKKATWGSIKNENYGIFITSRGCPFNCYYCSNNKLKKLYVSQKFTRYRDIPDIIEEVKVTVNKYNMKSVYFQDEVLTSNKERIFKLCELYKKEINLPWHCEARCETISDELVKVMADAGCEVIMMGIEAGSDRVRNEILGRNMSKETIINAFHLANKVGIKTSAFCMCGAPTETKEEILETIKLVKTCNPSLGKMTICNVLPGTPLMDYCKKNGYYIRNKFPKNYYIDSNLKHDYLTIKELNELRKIFVNEMGGYTGAVKKDEL